jgi:hypothetical protein
LKEERFQSAPVEMKAREMMFRESMCISLTPGTQPDTPDQEQKK